ncbi:MAG: histidine phosphotransferase [Rhodobacteraceae bacterium]|nr:histidine phosphotransferase [Paracoccaceae bacterium]
MDDPAKGLDLPALIAARICHDLISPLGAIGNGVELLEMAQSRLGPEIGLVRDSVQQAQARIRLFRIAFGQFRPDQMIGAEELAGLVRDYAAQARFDLHWDPAETQPKAIVRLALLCLLCVETVLPYGGQVVLVQDALSLHLRARSDKPKLEAALWSALSSEGDWPADLRAARVQFPLLKQAIAAQGMRLSLETNERGLDLRITAV